MESPTFFSPITALTRTPSAPEANQADFISHSWPTWGTLRDWYATTFFQPRPSNDARIRAGVKKNRSKGSDSRGGFTSVIGPPRNRSW